MLECLEKLTPPGGGSRGALLGLVGRAVIELRRRRVPSVAPLRRLGLSHDAALCVCSFP